MGIEDLKRRDVQKKKKPIGEQRKNFILRHDIQVGKPRENNLQKPWGKKFKVKEKRGEPPLTCKSDF